MVAGTIDSGRLFILKGGPKIDRTDNCDGDGSPLKLLTKIDGVPNSGHFASAILPVEQVDGDLPPVLAVSAVHADGKPWLMTGNIFVFNGETLSGEPAVADAKTIMGKARDMHLGSFLSLVKGGKWIAAGAPTENDNTGVVHFFDLSTLD